MPLAAASASAWIREGISIFAGGELLEEMGGFYQQFSVMVFTTNFWYILWSIGSIIAVLRRSATLNADEAEDLGYVQYGETTKPGV